MKLTEEAGDVELLRFTLTDKSPGADLVLVCHALNEELRQTWITHIKSLLDMQGHFLRGTQLILGICIWHWILADRGLVACLIRDTRTVFSFRYWFLYYIGSSQCWAKS